MIDELRDALRDALDEERRAHARTRRESHCFMRALVGRWRQSLTQTQKREMAEFLLYVIDDAIARLDAEEKSHDAP